MTTYRFIFILIMEVIRIIITRRFVLCFLESDENKTKKIVSYVFSVLITTLSYAFFNLSWLNLLSTVIGLSAIAISYRGSIKRKIIFVIYVLAVSCIIDLLVFALLNKTFDLENYSEPASILSLIILLMVQMLTGRMFKNYTRFENKHWWKYIISLAFCVATSLILFTDRTISIVSLEAVCGTFLFINLIMVYLLDDLIKKSQNEMNTLILKNQINLYEKEISLQNENAMIIRGIRHEMKRHFSEIYRLAGNGKIDEIRDYIRDFEKELEETSSISDCGNAGLDTVLNYMLEKAVKKNIDLNLKIAVPEDIELSIYDMNIIIGNLLENAIEACEKIDFPKIDLLISFGKDSLFIEVGNTWNGKVMIKDGCPVTTKSPKEEHGFGIKNIKKVLEKYQHTFDIEALPERFTVKILMKIL